VADNVAISNAPLTNYTVATDDIGSVHYQRVKLSVGADGVAVDASDTAPVPVYLPKAGTATVTSVADSASVQTLVAANAARKMLIICNDSTSILYVKFGSAATVADFSYKVLANGHLELPQPIYTGIVTGIWSADASGAAKMTEY
jgi:hypothetical protein